MKKSVIFLVAMLMVTFSSIAQKTDIQIDSGITNKYLAATRNYFEYMMNNYHLNKFWKIGRNTVGTKPLLTSGLIYSVRIDTSLKEGDQILTSLQVFVRQNNKDTKHFPLEVLGFAYNKVTNTGSLFYHIINADGTEKYVHDEQEVKERFENLFEEAHNLITF